MLKIFVSYCNEDRLAQILIPYFVRSLLAHAVFWCKRSTCDAPFSHQQIHSEIAQADIALLLVNQAYLDSQYIQIIELPKIIERTSKGKLHTVAILLGSCTWMSHAFLASGHVYTPSPSPIIDRDYNVIRKPIRDALACLFDAMNHCIVTKTWISRLMDFRYHSSCLDQREKIFLWIYEMNSPGGAFTEKRDTDMPSTISVHSSPGDLPRGLYRDHWKSANRDIVDCTVFAPPEAVPGESLLVQVFAHLAKQVKQVNAAAVEFDPETQRRGYTSLGTEIAFGSMLTFELCAGNLVVPDPVLTLRWNGRPDSVQFEVMVPAKNPVKSVVAKLLVRQNDTPIGRVLFKIMITPAATETSNNLMPVGEALRFKHAFISYASEDRDEVLRRIQMLSTVGICFFHDLLNLDPGQRWAQQLFKHIDSSDVLFLFWSRAASKSKWVRREWEYALQQKGLDFIQPVIIEGPPIVAPPRKLSPLHFNDKMLYLMCKD